MFFEDKVACSESLYQKKTSRFGKVVSLTSASNQPHHLLILLCDARSAAPLDHLPSPQPSAYSRGSQVCPPPSFPPSPCQSSCCGLSPGPALFYHFLCPPIYFSYIVSVFEAEDWAGLVYLYALFPYSLTCR